MWVYNRIQAYAYALISVSQYSHININHHDASQHIHLHAFTPQTPREYHLYPLVTTSTRVHVKLYPESIIPISTRARVKPTCYTLQRSDLIIHHYVTVIIHKLMSHVALCKAPIFHFSNFWAVMTMLILDFILKIIFQPFRYWLLKFWMRAADR